MTSAFAIVNAPGNEVSEIVIGGSRHLPAGEIARAHGYVRDYVARLCREGKVNGRRLGRHWYVDTESFATFVRGQTHGPSLSPTPSESISKPTL